MILSKREVRALITNCELAILEKYRKKINDDEYFHRGFLLACSEMKNEMLLALEKVEIRMKLLMKALDS
jgi:hypothetical protein